MGDVNPSNELRLILTGVGASVGRAKGTVRIVRSGTDDFPDHGVLVAHTTDPTFLRLMLRASAVITELGGRLSHAAIVALELGIPCVVAVTNACSLLHNDDVVLVDVTDEAGEVYLCGVN